MFLFCVWCYVKCETTGGICTLSSHSIIFAFTSSVKTSLPVLNNPLSARVRQVVETLRADRTPFMRVRGLMGK